MINVSQAVIDCLTEREGDKNIVPRSPESVSCRELEHKLQNVLVFSTDSCEFFVDPKGHPTSLFYTNHGLIDKAGAGPLGARL
jgi:hypothetical protein